MSGNELNCLWKMVICSALLYIGELSRICCAGKFDEAARKEAVYASYHQYCIIGAGPSGIQMAYFLQKANRDYIVYEQNSISGSFFVKYPRHRTLISINKRFTGQTNKEFNLRHDWNSLISDDENLLFTKYSKKFFPDADDMVTYLNDFSQRFNLNIQYNTTVQNISAYFLHKDFNMKFHSDIKYRKEHPDYFSNDTNLSYRYIFSDQNDVIYTCGLLLVATGWSRPNIPTEMKDEDDLLMSYENMNLDTDIYEGKTVLILGKGNSAFETADHIMGVAGVIHMISSSRVALAWQTHYVGDLRAVNNGFLDTYQLKSLSGIMEGDLRNTVFTKCLYHNRICIENEVQNRTNRNRFSGYDTSAVRDGYDIVISCLGFTFDFDMFEQRAKPNPAATGGGLTKFPAIDARYISIPGMYILGPLAHSLDYKKSAGGFIHGFRYTTRALSRLLEFEFHSVVWPSITSKLNHLENHIVKRINEMSGPYQMFGVLGEVILIDTINSEFTHFEEFPVKLMDQFEETTGHLLRNRSLIVVTLEYGANFSHPGADTMDIGRARGAHAHIADNANFLHPVFYYYKNLPTSPDMETINEKAILPIPDDVMMLAEEFLTEWNTPNTHILQLRRWLEKITNSNRRHYSSTSCFEMSLHSIKPPSGCKSYLNDEGFWFDVMAVNLDM